MFTPPIRTIHTYNHLTLTSNDLNGAKGINFLEEKNPLIREYEIHFEEEKHKYSLCRKNIRNDEILMNLPLSRHESLNIQQLNRFYYLISSSQLVKENFLPFEKDKIINNMVNKMCEIIHKGNKLQSKWKKYEDVIKIKNDGFINESKTKLNIERHWDYLRDRGTILHQEIEYYINLYSSLLYLKNNLSEEEYSNNNSIILIQYYYNYIRLELEDKKVGQQFLNFFSDYFTNSNWQPFRTELRMSLLNTAGTVDFLAYDNKTNEYHMIDWKYAEISFPNSFYIKKYGIKACKHLKDCNYNHYKLQLSIYKYQFTKCKNN